jgi:hypothetical protein
MLATAFIHRPGIMETMAVPVLERGLYPLKEPTSPGDLLEAQRIMVCPRQLSEQRHLVFGQTHGINTLTPQDHSQMRCKWETRLHFSGLPIGTLEMAAPIKVLSFVMLALQPACSA